MSSNRYPTAKTLFKNEPLPVLATTVLKISRTRLYCFRLSKGEGIEGETVYFLEVKNILGTRDQFSHFYEDSFEDYDMVKETYLAAKREAEIEYQRLKKKSEERLKNAEKNGQYTH